MPWLERSSSHGFCRAFAVDSFDSSGERSELTDFGEENLNPTGETVSKLEHEVQSEVASDGEDDGGGGALGDRKAAKAASKEAKSTLKSVKEALPPGKASFFC